MSTTHYIPGSSGWASQKVNWGSSSAGNGRLRLVVTRTYDQSTNKSTLSFRAYVCSTVLDGPFQVTQGSTVKINGSTLYTFPQATVFGAAVNKSTSWDQIVRKSGAAAENHWDLTLSHDAGGNLSATVEVNLTMTYTLGGTTYVMHWTNSGTLTASEPRGSTITGVTNPATTQGSMTINVNRAGSAFYHKAKVKKGGTVLVTTGAFATSTSISVPRSWFQNYPNDVSLSCTVEVQTYTDQSCTTAIGDPATASVTVKADSGMKPMLQSGYASAAPYNTGTAAAGITGCVSGVSKAQVTLDPSKLDMSAAVGASVATIAVTGGGVTDTSSPYRTGVLRDTAAITVTVTDTRGRSTARTLTVECMPYAAPTLSLVTVFRCDSQGAEDENGSYLSVQATGGVSSLNNQNSLTLTAAWAQGGGSYGAENALQSGTRCILGGTLDPDRKLSVRITAKDSLNTETATAVLLPPRIWAMKFRPNGQGVGFGMAPTEDRVLQLPAGWKIKIGDTIVAQG